MFTAIGKVSIVVMNLVIKGVGEDGLLPQWCLLAG
jgi:hypothetical protein